MNNVHLGLNEDMDSIVTAPPFLISLLDGSECSVNPEKQLPVPNA